MRFEQLSDAMLAAVIETLPVEITVIDANDEVAAWNRHENRLFRRPMTAMGLNFRQCHPEKSLPIVERIVEEMRRGERDSARFWIDLATPGDDARKHKVLIEFFALRGPAGEYLGCMEVTQDVQHARDLQGEKRLLD